MIDQKLLSELTLKYFEETSENIIGVGYGYKTTNNLVTDEKSLIFKVKKKLNISDIPENEQIPSIINFSGNTFKTDVIECEIKFLEECPSDFYSWQTTNPNNRNKIRPLQGGISLTNYTASNGSWVGTLGFLAIDNETNSLVGVSNNHVLVEDAFITSDRNPRLQLSNILNNVATQPNEPTDKGLQNSIGFIKKYYPLRFDGYNNSDVALTTINESDISYSESYLQLGLTGWTEPLEFATTQEIDDLLYLNPNLFSSGRTSGAKGEGDMKLLTYATNVVISISYERQGLPTTIQFDNCIEFVASAATTPNGSICIYPIAPGDSGSALIADINGTRKIIGLVFAGVYGINNIVTYGLANRIDNIANNINISPWLGNSIEFSNTAATQTHLVVGRSSENTITIDNNIFWQGGLISALTPTPTSTNIIIVTPTNTVTSTTSKTPTPTITPTSSKTPTPTITPTNTITPTSSITPTSTNTITPTITATNTVTPSLTKTPYPNGGNQYYWNEETLNWQLII